MTVEIPKGLVKVAEAICGCGDPDVVWKFLHDGLLEMSRESKPRVDIGDDAGKWLRLYVLDDWGLMEHGANIFFGWLTPDGHEALEFLNKWGSEWRSKPIAEVEFEHNGCVYNYIG